MTPCGGKRGPGGGGLAQIIRGSVRAASDRVKAIRPLLATEPVLVVVVSRESVSPTEELEATERAASTAFLVLAFDAVVCRTGNRRGALGEGSGFNKCG